MQEDTKNLFNLIINTGAFQHSDDDKCPFILTSGKTSPYYFDLKKLCGDPVGINAVAKVLYDHILLMPGVKSVAGIESGSISIAAAISQYSHIRHLDNPSDPEFSSCYVRKFANKHGMMNLIEGRVESPVVIVDDVITSGNSALAAVRAVRGKQFECKSIMSVIFRGSDFDKSVIKEKCNLHYIFEQEQFIQHYELTATKSAQ